MNRPSSYIITLFALGTSLVLALSLGACARKKNPANTDGIFHIPTPNLMTAQAIAERAKVSCGEASCDPAVGMLVNIAKDEVSTCTAFLISPHTALTNSHCLPAHLRSQESDCRGQIKILFAEHAQNPAENLECKKVILASSLGDTRRTRDYALLELATPSSRQPLPLSRDGVSDGESLLAIKVDPQKEREAIGLIKAAPCRVVERSILFPSAFGLFTPVAGIADCQIIAGNSGSPLISRKGEAKAIAQARLQLSEDRKNQILSLAKAEKIPPFALATNLACLPDHPLHLDCFRLPDRWEKERPAINEQLLAEAELEKLKEQMSQKALLAGFKYPAWEVRRIRSGKESLYATLPLCQSLLNTKISTPAFWLRLNFNQYLQASAETADTTTEISFFANEMEVLGPGEISFSEALPACESEL